jgi:SAM-dependent methyltransferase
MANTKPFDLYVDEYEAWFTRHKEVYLSEIEAARYFLLPDAKGMEVGIGTGRFAVPLGIKEGIEPSEAMRQKAKEQGLNVIDAVAEDLPAADNSYDFVLLVTAICFIDDAYKALNEIHRILKPDGRVIIGLVDLDTPLGKLYLQEKDKNKFYKSATFYSAEEVISILRETGFTKIESVQTLFDMLDKINTVQPVKKGHGTGGFVVIKGEKHL